MTFSDRSQAIPLYKSDLKRGYPIREENGRRYCRQGCGPLIIAIGLVLTLAFIQCLCFQLQSTRYLTFTETKSGSVEGTANSSSLYNFREISTTFEHLWSTNIKRQRNISDPWMLERENRHVSQTQHLQRERNKYRKQSCRPPPFSKFSVDRFDSLYIRNDRIAHVEYSLDDEILGVIRERMSNGNQRNTLIQELCDKAQLTATSRVVLINPFSTQLSSNNSTTLGTASLFTLFISKQCAVKNVVIVDSMQPNTKKYRLQSMNTYRTLFRDITGLQLIVPLATAGLAQNEDKDLQVEWLSNFSPTHILLFENANHHQTEFWNEHLSTKGQQLYHIKNSILSFQQLLHHCNDRSSNGASNGKFNVPTMVDSMVFLHVVVSDTWRVNEKNMSPIHRMLADYYQTMMNHSLAKGGSKGSVHLHHLQIPSNTNQLVTNDESPKFFSLPNENALAIDNQDVLPLIVGIMHALQPEKDQRRRIMSISSENPSLTQLHDPAGISDNLDFYGLNEVSFPCASSCNSSRRNAHNQKSCTSSVLDYVALVSRSVTSGCDYVVYSVMEISGDESDLKLRFKADGASGNTCHVAYASSQSPMMQNALQRLLSKDPDAITDMDKYNGKLESSDGIWTLVLFPQRSLENADLSLFRIEPSHLFSSTVKKAMYVSHAIRNTTAFVSDDDMHKMLSSIDFEKGQAVQPRFEYRSGKPDVFRTIEPPTSPRTVLLHANESPTAAAKFGEYISRIGKERNLKISSYRQLTFYKQMNHYVQVGDNRPQNDLGSGKFKKTFPWHWISLESYVHDLQSEPARQLRCLWYEAHHFFGKSSLIPDTEDLSLAYVIGKQRMEGYLGPTLQGDTSWIPVMDRQNEVQETYVHDEGEEVMEEVERMSEFFIRVMPYEIAEDGATFNEQ